MKSESLVIPLVLAAAMLLVMVAPALAGYPDEPPAPAGPAKLPPVAIGAMRLSGTHLVPPARDPSLLVSVQEGQPLSAAAQAWYDRFQKQTDTWPNARFQEWALQREAQLSAGNLGPMAIQPVTATVFAMAVDFGATETFTIPVEQPNGSCLIETTTITGPLAGMMPRPPATDNFTLWYSPTLTADAKFYEKIIFGYEGAGRARYDLTDPDDGLPGINLAGLTVQDYYDHVAGDGNVYITGTVEGWVTVPHSEGYYGADICELGSTDGGAGHNAADLVVDALREYSQTHPSYWTDPNFWPTYDGNNDGVLDTLWVIHAGAGQESGGGAEGTFAIWSHSSDLRNHAAYEHGFKVYEGDRLTTTDDIIVGPYTFQPENAEVGVFAEEFGHNFFGFPDLYTYDANNSVGYWNIMSGGAWMGWLGGTRPASMPLWFKMIAAFETGGTLTPVNWHEPMVTRGYTDTAGNVTIGQLEKTPSGVDKGVRINLPSYTEVIPNPAGTGKGAYSGTGRDETDARLTRQVEVGASVTGILTMDTYWDIEENWDYGYVMVNGMPIADMDGVTTNFDPYGNNLGNGITGHGMGTLRFDLSTYAGQTITLTLRYKTDAVATEDGWWVDDVALDGVSIDDFEDAITPDTFLGWMNSDPGWLVVPVVSTYHRYYLVEYRAMTKYDQMIAKSAYVHNYADGPEGDVVSRIPYNLPAALVYYRDTQYGSSYLMHGYESDPPSYGSKYQLLIVDQNWRPMRTFNGTMGFPDVYTGYWSGWISSYDAGLTLQATKPFIIPRYWAYPDEPPQIYPSKPAVTKFNDAMGYYAGEFYGAPCPTGMACWHERDGSAVIPARGLYSSRITDFNFNPIYRFYGWQLWWLPSWWGSGNPGDDNVQFGVNIELQGTIPMVQDGSAARLKISNYSVDIETTHSPTLVEADVGDTYTLTYQTVVENTGTEVANNVTVTYTLDSKLTYVSMLEENDKGTVKPPMGTLVPPVWWTDELAAGETATLTLKAIGVAANGWVETMVDAFDGQISRGPWFFETEIDATYYVFLPVTMRDIVQTGSARVPPGQ